MRRLLVLLLFALPLAAQHRETLEVRIVELDVVVVDRAGNPVDGLQQSDFEVQIGGKKKDVANFYAVKRGAVIDERPEGAAPESAVAAQTMIPTSVVILVDDTRLRPHSKQRAMAALKDYVRQNVGQHTTAMLARWNGALQVRTRPTELPGPLLAELEKMSREPALLSDSDRTQIITDIEDAMTGVSGGNLAQRVDQTWHQMMSYAEREARVLEQTIEGLRETVKLAGALEGRKAVLYVSEGLPTSAAAEIFDYWERMTHVIDNETNSHLQQEIARGNYTMLDHMRYDRTSHYERLAKQAQAAGVSFYGLDAAGVRTMTMRGPETRKSIAHPDSALVRMNEQSGVRLVADQTGGRFISEENDFGKALTVLSQQFTTYYSLGVRGAASTRLARVRVAVKGRPELRVITARHRHPTSREQELERGVRARLYNPRAENPLNAALDLGAPSSVAAQCIVPLRVTVSRDVVRTSNGSALDVYFALLDEKFQESDVRSSSILAGAGDVAHSMSLGLQPGKYMLSVAVTDRMSGETSYLQREIDASGCR